MLVRANELVQNQKNNTVAASGNVEIYHKGSILQADRVVLDQATSKVRASGKVKITQADGNVVYADELELTQDFSQGFIESMRLETPDNTRFAGARADRSQGNLMVFQSGVYTACEPCRDNPSRPPFVAGARGADHTQ